MSYLTTPAVSKSGPPTVTDDVAAGFVAGALLVDTSVSPVATYVCTSNAAGAAVWIPLSTIGVLAPASPYSVASMMQRIVVTANTTVNLRAVSTYPNTGGVVVINGSGSSVDVTVDPAGSDTLDGGAAGAASTYTVPARGALGVVKTGAAAWGSVQSGSSTAVVASSARIYISDGVMYAVGEYLSAAGTWTAVGAPVAMTIAAGGAKVTLSGTSATLASGAADIARPDPASLAGQGQCWYVSLAALGISAIPYAANLRMHMAVLGTKPTVAFGYYCGAMLLGAWATSAETHAYIALSYDANNAIRYGFSTGAFGNWGTLAAYEQGMLDVGSQFNSARWAYRDTAGSLAGILGTGTPGTGTVTHLGIAIGAVYGATAADCTFANPQSRFTWSSGP